jgi:RimJ/RimL family protein N-acetyltransferase
MQFILANGEGLSIRPPDLEDAAALLHTFQRLVSETDFLLTTPGEARHHSVKSELDFIRSFRNNPNNLFLLALVNHQIIGTLSVTQGNWKKLAHTGEFGIAVVREYWNMGIGRRLLTHMFRWAMDNQHIKMLYCKVMANNEKALHLYKSFGFAEQGRLEKFFLQPDGKLIDLLYMVRWLE